MKKHNNKTNLNMEERKEIKKVFNSKFHKIYDELPELPFWHHEPIPKHNMIFNTGFWADVKEWWFEDDVTIQNNIKKIWDRTNKIYKKRDLDFSKELDECAEIMNNLIKEIQEEFNLNK